jgi:hypothetical protein
MRSSSTKLTDPKSNECPYKRQNWRHKGKSPQEDGRREWKYEAVSQKIPRSSKSCPKLGERHVMSTS